MPNIIDFYEKNLWKNVGSVVVDRGGLTPPYKTGLLHLVYWLIYDEKGRQFLHETVPSSTLTVEQVKAELRKKFETEYNVRPAASEALQSVHFAGLAWVAAHEANNGLERDKQEAAVKQSMAAVAWCLWEDVSGPLFPLGW